MSIQKLIIRVLQISVLTLEYISPHKISMKWSRLSLILCHQTLVPRFFHFVPPIKLQTNFWSTYKRIYHNCAAFYWGQRLHHHCIPSFSESCLWPLVGPLWLLGLPPTRGPGALPIRRPHLQEERHTGRHGHSEGLAERAQEEPVPHQGGEDHVGHYHQDDPDAGVHLVRQRPAATKEGEQDDVDPTEPERGRRGGGQHRPGAEWRRRRAPEVGSGRDAVEERSRWVSWHLPVIDPSIKRPNIYWSSKTGATFLEFYRSSNKHENMFWHDNN